jgi:hypothetical protein
MARIPLWVGLTVVGLSAMWIALGSLILPSARSHDFLNIYTGASLAHEGRFADLHDPEVQLARERQIIPQLNALVPFVRPGFYAALLMPLALLPYGAAFVVWIAAQSALLLGCWAWTWRRFGPDALVFAALFLPCPLGIASGQDCVMMLALFILVFELAERSRWFAAGAALALMLMKFHLILLWPVALLIQRRWRMLAGFCATALALAGFCVALGGIGSLRVYAALLQNKSLDHLSPSPELMISFQGLLANLGIEARWASAFLIGAAVVVFLWSIRAAPLWRLFALTAVASLWIVPHVYGYYASLLLLPIMLAIFRSAAPASRIAATLLSTPIPFGFALAGRPWAIVSSASVAIFLLLLAGERKAPPEEAIELKDRARTP